MGTNLGLVLPPLHAAHPAALLRAAIDALPARHLARLLAPPPLRRPQRKLQQLRAVRRKRLHQEVGQLGGQQHCEQRAAEVHVADLELSPGKGKTRWQSTQCAPSYIAAPGEPIYPRFQSQLQQQRSRHRGGALKRNALSARFRSAPLSRGGPDGQHVVTSAGGQYLVCEGWRKGSLVGRGANIGRGAGTFWPTMLAATPRMASSMPFSLWDSSAWGAVSG